MALKFNMYPQQTTPGYYNQGTTVDPYSGLQEAAKTIGEGLGTSMAIGKQKIKKHGGLGPLGKAWRKYKKSGIDPTTNEPWAYPKRAMEFKDWKKSSLGLATKDRLKYDKLQKRLNISDEEMKRAMEMAKDKYTIVGKKRQKGQTFTGKLHAGAFTNWLKSEEGKEFKKDARQTKREAAATKRDVWGGKVAEGIRGFPKSAGEKVEEWGEKVEEWGGKVGEGIQGLPAKIPNLSQGFPTPNLEKMRDYKIAPYGGILGKMFTPAQHAIRKQAASGEFTTPSIAGLSGLQRALPSAGLLLGSKEKQFADWYDYAQGLDRQNLPKGFGLDELSFMAKYGGWGGLPKAQDKIGSVIEKQGYRGQ